MANTPAVKATATMPGSVKILNRQEIADAACHGYGIVQQQHKKSAPLAPRRFFGVVGMTTVPRGLLS